MAGIASCEDPSGTGLHYLPQARLREGASILGIASACMDTSDGVLAALDQLMRLNGTGFELAPGWEELLSPWARAEFRSHGLPAWIALAGHHGEFELLFTVPESLRDSLGNECARSGWSARELGKAVAAPEVTLPLYGGAAALDTGFLRDLSFQCGTDPGAYVRALLAYDADLRKGATGNVNA
jgi:thiamine-monophosphate kinase